ncbi:MAG TPA: hypothetical protein VFW33_12490, partial [Gemmataceae bacterium]|nr:hypothetical protein [Gemmataceae bacterium]
ATLLDETSEYRRPGTTPSDKLTPFVTDRFVKALREGEPPGSLVVVLDTLEDAQLHQPAALLSVIRILADLRSRLPSQPTRWQRLTDAVRRLLGRPGRATRLILVLAGRYNLLDSPNNALPGFRDDFGAQTLPLLLQEFSTDEAREYLVKKRELPRDEPAVGVITERAGGNPFKLALYADLFWEGVTAAEIAADPRVDEAYLIQRIVNRIKNEAVRWLLNYGVVPRRLTREFVERVMVPALPDSCPDPAPAWDELKRYASTYSWVRGSGPEPDALQFQPDVVGPRRRLLASEDPAKYRELHERAAAYFAARVAPRLTATDSVAAQKLVERAAAYGLQPADEDPGLWPVRARELLYHLAPLRDPGIAALWETLMAVARRMPAGEGREELAHELTLAEYDEVVKPSTQARAFLEEAVALAERARADPDGDTERLWVGARNAFNKARERDAAVADPERVPAAAWLRLALVSREGGPADGLDAARRPVPPGASAAERLAHALLAAEMLGDLGWEPEAAGLLEGALEAAQPPPRAGLDFHTSTYARVVEEERAAAEPELRRLRLAAHLALGELKERLGQFAAAAGQYDLAAPLARDENDPVPEWEVRLRAVWVAVWTGRPRPLDPIPPAGLVSNGTPRGAALLARWWMTAARVAGAEWDVLKAMRRAREAVRLAETLLTSARPVPSRARPALRLLGEARLVLGRALADLLEFAEADRELNGSQ